MAKKANKADKHDHGKTSSTTPEQAVKNGGKKSAAVTTKASTTKASTSAATTEPARSSARTESSGASTPAQTASAQPSSSRSSELVGRPEPVRAGTARSAARTSSGPVVDELTRALLVPVQVAQKVLPNHRVPVYLGAAALAMVGILEWPVALGAGIAWEALRRWGPRSDR